MGRGERRYRTKLEVLRDFLEAVRRHPRKTRIIGLANLNPGSYARYRTLSLRLGLIAVGSDGCYLSPRGGAALEALRRYSAKSSELGEAYAALQRSVLGSGLSGSPRAEPPNYASRAAWSEIVSPLARGPARAIAIDPLASPLTIGGEFPGLEPRPATRGRDPSSVVPAPRGRAIAPPRALGRTVSRTPSQAEDDEEFDA